VREGFDAFYPSNSVNSDTTQIYLSLAGLGTCSLVVVSQGNRAFDVRLIVALLEDLTPVSQELSR